MHGRNAFPRRKAALTVETANGYYEAEGGYALLSQ
jgi:hypothetical protein